MRKTDVDPEVSPPVLVPDDGDTSTHHVPRANSEWLIQDQQILLPMSQPKPL